MIPVAAKAAKAKASTARHTGPKLIQPGSLRACVLCKGSLTGRGETARYCHDCRIAREKIISDRSHAERKEQLYRARRLGLPVMARRKLDPEQEVSLPPSFCVHLLDGMGLTAAERIGFEYEDDRGQVFHKCRKCYLEELEA